MASWNSTPLAKEDEARLVKNYKKEQECMSSSFVEPSEEERNKIEDKNGWIEVAIVDDVDVTPHPPPHPGCKKTESNSENEHEVCQN